MQRLADGHRGEDRRAWGCWHSEEERPRRPLAWASPSWQREPEVRAFPTNKTVFNALVEEWWEQSTYESVTRRVAMSPAYQKMIGMGRGALPLILARLRTEPSPHWFWALRAIAHQDPAEGTTEVGAASQAWLEWGRSKGYLPG